MADTFTNEQAAALARFFIENSDGQLRFAAVELGDGWSVALVVDAADYANEDSARYAARRLGAPLIAVGVDVDFDDVAS